MTTTTTAMGPPPPPSDDTQTTASSSSNATTVSMGPPKNPNPTNAIHEEEEEGKGKSSRHSVPYTIPEWSGPPSHQFFMEVLKDGSIVDEFDIYDKGAYMFGRVDLCDFVLDHPTISRFHAVIQFRRNGEAYLYDIASTHGTFVNKTQVEKKVYVPLYVGDVIRFGQSSRLYIFQGPPDLMPPETDLKSLRDAKIRRHMMDREASLQRARVGASLADGISWGMGEDAVEEAEDDADEITWQTYKGQLTDKQEKTREKIIKRTEKIAHMKKEIDAIRAKDIAQGGLTQGQQTQIARNEQRITQIMEELENLEETLNESIRESIGARVGISHGKRKGATEDDEELLSDDDEFYDRTKKSSVRNVGENQSIETADTLLDKRDAIMKEMDAKRESLMIEKNKMASEPATGTDVGDTLDAFMSGVSSQIVHDITAKLEKELSALQSELDRIFFLLKIADPSGEAAKKRVLKSQEPKPDKAEVPATTKKQPHVEPKTNGLRKSTNVSMQKEKTIDSEVSPVDSNDKPEADQIVIDAPEGKKAVYTVTKPQWLGAVNERESQESQQTEVLNIDDSDQFVDYKDRQKILRDDQGEEGNVDSGIESAAAGLIIRKPKETEIHEAGDNGNNQQHTSSSLGAELMADDAVTLLLKHKRGYRAEDEEEQYENPEKKGGHQPDKDYKKPKRVLGPEKPTFLNSNSDYESWVPPEGQSGDGRTSLNERYGY